MPRATGREGVRANPESDVTKVWCPPGSTGRPARATLQTRKVARRSGSLYLGDVMARKPVLITAAVLALVAAGAVGASVSAYAGGSSTPSAPKSATSPARPAGVRPATVRPYTAATNAHCGMTVTAALTLNGDLICGGFEAHAALTVTANSITLNLNGHGIFGFAGTSQDGIDIEGVSDTVQNGFVRGWADGVKVDGMKDTVTKIYASGNQVGIFDRGATDRITNNTAYANTTDGFDAFGNSGGSLTSDRASGNSVDGFDIGGSNYTVTASAAGGNTIDGFLDEGTHVTFSSNSANNNGRDGIDADFGDDELIDLGGNTAKGNGYGSGGTPVQCVNITCG